MPYIKHQDRAALALRSRLPESAGELNYLITIICLDYVTKHGTSYQTYNDVIGAMEGAKLELYRRRVAEYEDVKVKENGDLF